MINFTVGLILALIYSILVFPKNVGECPKISPTIYPILYKGMIFLPYGKKSFHIHHWIIAFFFCLYFYNKNQYIYGFSLGLLLQWLTYNDSYKIISPNPYNKK